MVLQNGAGAGVGHRTFEHTFDSLSFAFIGNNVDDDFALADLRNAHAECVSGNSIKGGEPAFAQLLITAGIIQFYNQEGFVGIKVSRRVIESDVTVFANTDKSNINGVIGKNFLHLGTESGRIIGITAALRQLETGDSVKLLPTLQAAATVTEGRGAVRVRLLEQEDGLFVPGICFVTEE